MQRSDIVGLTVFFTIAFLVPWLGWSLIDAPALHLWLFPLCCSLGGFAAAWAAGGTGGLRRFCRRTLNPVGALGWTVLAALLPLAIGLLYLLLNGVPLSAMQPSARALLGLTLGAALVTGPLAEEFGWRGYLQPLLLRHMRPLYAVPLVALLWAAWHIPLFGYAVFGTPVTALRFFGYLLAWSAFMACLVLWARGSVWPAVAFHWGANVHANVLGVLFPGLDGGALPGGSKGLWLYLLAAAACSALYWRFGASARTAPSALPFSAR